MASVERELIERLHQLDDEQQAQVLEFARSLGRPRGVPAESLLRFAGSIPLDDLEKMSRVIEEDCERINPDEW